MESQVRHVHHSYIWLGGLKSGGIVTFALFVSAAGSLVPLVLDFLNGKLGVSSLWTVPLAILGSIFIIAVILGLNVLIYWISWRFLTYELTDEEFSIHSGVLSKKHSHIPYRRIQSVDVRASLLQRIAGVCTVEIDTAGGASNKAIMVPYITKSEAARLKEELFRRKRVALSSNEVVSGGETAAVASGQGQQVASNVLDSVETVFSNNVGIFDEGAHVVEEPISYKVGLSNRELLLAGLSEANGSIGVIITSIIIFCCTIGVVDVVADGFGSYLDSYFETGMASGATLSALISRLLLNFLPYIVGVCVFSFAVTFLISAVATLVSYGGFQARRRGTRIEVERGLLQRQTQGIDVNRVQLLRIDQGWIRRLIGYCKVSVGRIDSAAGDDGKGGRQADLEVSQGVVVHPFLKISDLEGFVGGLIPELQCQCKMKSAPSPRGLRRAMLRGALWFNAGFWALVVILAAFLGTAAALFFAAPEELGSFCSVVYGLSPLLIAFIAVMAIGSVRGVKWHKGSCLEYGNGFVRIVNEGFSRKEVVVPRQKIQFASLVANPFQLVGKYRTVKVTTAAGSNRTSEDIWDIELEDAEAFYEWVRPKR